MNKNFLSILLLCTAAIAHADAPGKHLKAGVVSATDIMMGTEIGQNANKRIDAKRLDMMNKLQKEAAEVQKLEDGYKARMTTMSETSKREEAVKIESRKQEIELKNKQYMQELQVAAQKEMEDLRISKYTS